MLKVKNYCRVCGSLTDKLVGEQCLNSISREISCLGRVVAPTSKQEIFAHAVYNILVASAGAKEEERIPFVRYLCENFSKHEWRFQGHFGFGGKYYFPDNRVSCYLEDETPELLEMIQLINNQLKTIQLDEQT